MKKLLQLTVLVFAVSLASLVTAQVESGFTSLFDGKSFDGWKANESQDAFTIEDGAIKAKGARCHLFYEGKVNGAVFRNFELRMDVMTRQNSNGGVFFHTIFQNEGWPTGYEAQVNNTQKDPQKSGTLYNTVKNLEPLKDDVWMRYVIVVKDGAVVIRVDDKELVNHKPEAGQSKLRPDGGTIALQAHDAGSTVYYQNIRIKILD
jgi:hypothetical protein